MLADDEQGRRLILFSWLSFTSCGALLDNVAARRSRCIFFEMREIVSCRDIRAKIATSGVSGYPLITQHGCMFSGRPRDNSTCLPSEPSFRFPRRGRPESPGLRLVPEKMRSRHCASPGRDDTCRYLSRPQFAELTGYLDEFGVHFDVPLGQGKPSLRMCIPPI